MKNKQFFPKKHLAVFGAIVLVLIVLLLLLLPGIYIGMVPPGPQGKLTQGLNYCRQLNLALQMYYSDRITAGAVDSSQPTISTLVKEKYIDQSFLNNLIRNKGIYFVYLPAPNSSPNDISIQYFSEYGTAEIRTSGAGIVNLKRK
jgi:hypothetical protein